MANKIAVWTSEFISISALVFTAIFLVVNWGNLPSRIPTHFSPNGQANKWGDKHMILLLILLDFGIYLVLSVAARYQEFINLPIKVDRESPIVTQRLREMLTLLKVVAALSFGFIIWTITQAALGRSQGLGRAFLPILLISNLGIVLVYLASIRNKQSKHP